MFGPSTALGASCIRPLLTPASSSSTALSLHTAVPQSKASVDLRALAPNLMGFGVSSPASASSSSAGTIPTIPISLVDHKSQLASFAQKYLMRPVTKTDITYSTRRVGYQHQCRVTLHFLNGAEYAGELGIDAKTAEKNAARVALAECKPIADAIPADLSKRPNSSLTPEEKAIKKAKTEAAGIENPADTYKTKLNAALMRIAKRKLTKEDSVYTCLNVAGGFQATVSLKALPGDWSTRAWAGHVMSTKQKAEQSVAEIAYFQITSDPELSILLHEEPKKKVHYKDLPPSTKLEATPKMKGKGKGWKGKWSHWTAWSGYNHWRERIVPDLFTGDVVEWKQESSLGFVRPHVDIDDLLYKKRDGKLIVRKVDLKGGVERLEKDTVVTFFVYKDSSGLGAEEVEPC